MNVPQLSVVLVVDHYGSIRRVVDRLREQTAQEEIELVIVGPSRQALELDPMALAGVAGVRVVECGSIHPMPPARAAGVRAASAPLVFLGETHTFAHPEFAATLIRAHRDSSAVVVPGIGNANPDGALSWAAFLMDYGQAFHALPAGEIEAGPGWNVAYKRAALLEFEAALDTMLDSSDALMSALRGSGHRYRFAPDARLDHANVSRPLAWTDERYLSGLLFGSSRAARWSLARRLLYIVASPLIPFVYLSRIMRPVQLAARAGMLPRGTFAGLLVGAVVRTAGEVVGYAVGASREAERRMDDYELHKLNYVVSPAGSVGASPA
jgi:hypothetical protein